MTTHCQHHRCDQGRPLMYRPIVIRGKEWQGREMLRRSGKVGSLRKRLRIETARFERSRMGAGGPLARPGRRSATVE